MKYSIGDKIIFNKKYEKNINQIGMSYYTTKGSRGWVEPWLIGKVATIKEISEMGWYYIDIPDTHGYDKALFNKLDEEVLVEL